MKQKKRNDAGWQLGNALADHPGISCRKVEK